MDAQKIASFLEKHGQPRFRLGQVKEAVFQKGISSFSQISTLPKELRDLLARDFPLLSFEVLQLHGSQDGRSAKALLKLSDGSSIETVLISPKEGLWSVCVSCQVGCAMGCRFCATGQMGFRRNLVAEEITDQILFWRQYLKNNKHLLRNFDVTNVVYMGMGEPFNNWENVSQSIRILTDPEQFAFGMRAISVSTSGVAEGIMRLAKEFPQVNLALSLHFATDEQRGYLMPVNKKDDLASLKKALQAYFQQTRRKVFIEYILLEGLNDRALDAKNLAAYLKSIGNLPLLHVNLIRYNTVSDIFMPSTRERTVRFKQELKKMGISATIRKSLGEEIKGACGQLAAD
ncbi:MAG TPA: 23S rRNA (adenine(2503)-C(2))-methyltransferase RlmN [Candidatus Moranbacteria bacterium]|nr:23S rRNA (adenine(2503)-C(2))-methyltransferase RlmN [Candidatus Moranbacteria bacterium]